MFPWIDWLLILLLELYPDPIAFGGEIIAYTTCNEVTDQPDVHVRQSGFHTGNLPYILIHEFAHEDSVKASGSCKNYGNRLSLLSAKQLQRMELVELCTNVARLMDLRKWDHVRSVQKTAFDFRMINRVLPDERDWSEQVLQSTCPKERAEKIIEEAKNLFNKYDIVSKCTPQTGDCIFTRKEKVGGG
jgi:hypothetical protein